MSKQLPRRRFLKTAVSAGAAAVVAPHIIPSSALGLDGSVAPSERIVIGGIGIGNRGTYDLGCFLEQKDVQFVAVCDVKAARREAIKKGEEPPKRTAREWSLPVLMVLGALLTVVTVRKYARR